MRNWYAAALSLLIGLYVLPASASGIHPDGYTIYEGDINGDGVDDLYFQYEAPLIILHGEVATPIRMPQLPNFGMHGISTGGYQTSYEVTLSVSQISALSVLDESSIVAGDFNGDGSGDLFVYGPTPIVLQGVATAIPFTVKTFSASYPDAIDQLILSSSPGSIKARDVDGDGLDDLVVSGSNGTGTQVLYAGAGSFSRLPEVIAPQAVNIAGTSSGDFRVNESGAATYSIAIATAIGTAGVVPEVALNYSSNAGNGIAGKGWSIGGLSNITRCRKSLSIDGEVAPLRWTKSDRFCLDGQRLILVGGSEYGAVGATYQTEIDSYAKIFSVGGSIGKPSYFKVEKKDGSTSYYGSSVNSSLQVGGNTLVWALNRFQDNVGNKIDYIYEGDSASGHRIKQIEYAFGGGSSAAQIVFSYGDRPDYLRGYTSGYEFLTTKRLTKITSRSDGKVIREYTLSYLPATMQGHADKTSLLANVQECVGASCLPALSFDWSLQDIGYSLVANSSIDFTWNSSRSLRSYEFADFDGDGRQDIVWLELDADEGDEDHQVRYALSNGTGFVPAKFSNGDNFLFSGANANENIGVQVLDFNADGRSDIAVFDNRYSSKTWHIYLSTYVSGAWKLSSTAIDSGISNRKTVFADFNSDGLVDAISASGTSLSVRLLVAGSEPISSSSFYEFSSAQSYAISIPSGKSISRLTDNPLKSINGDFNGDGAVDILVALEQPSVSGCKDSSGKYVDLDFCLDSSGNLKPGFTYAYSASAAGMAAFVFDSGSNRFEIFESSVSGLGAEGHVAVDINGDGLSDLITRSSSYANVYISTGENFERISTTSFASENFGVADLNQDGFQDIFWPDFDSGWLKANYWNSVVGNFDSSVYFKVIVKNDKNTYFFADVNADSQPDFHELTENGDLSTYVSNYDSSGGATKPNKVIKSIDNGLGNVTEISYENLTNGTVYSRLGMAASTSQECVTLPQEPDGEGGYIGGQTYCYTTSAGNPSSLYSTLNGPWALPSGSQTLGKDKPVLDVLPPLFVVSKVESAAPAAGVNPGAVNFGAKSSVSYHYHQMKVQAAGRGMLGFHRITTTDNQSGVETETTYRQDYPFTGMPLQTEIRSAEGELLRRATNNWRLQGWGGSGNPARPYRPFIYKSVEETYDLENNGASKGGLLQTQVSEYAYDQYGNALAVEVTTANVATGEQFVKSTTSCYGGTMAAYPGTGCSGGSQWDQEKGRLSFTRVVNSRPGVAGHIGESSFTYYTSGTLKGLLKSEVVEPNKPAYTQTTGYEYDGFGNISKKTLSAVGEQSRYTRTEYDTFGRYGQKSYNGLEHLTEHVVSRNHFGAPLEVHGLNGLKTYFSYDALGREIYRYDNTGADARTQYLRCQSGCVAGAKYKVIKSSNTGASSTEYMDALGRVFRTETQGFTKTIYTDRQYDSLGRLKYVSEPYFAGSVPVWTETEFDLLGRPVKVTAPDASQSLIAYDGLKTITTNDKGQRKTEVKNAAGELVEVIDALNGRLTYEYDSRGNLHKAHSWGKTDVNGNHIDEGDGLVYPITVTINYDQLGRKEDMDDPDKGKWYYTYNKYGELKKQTNANGHTVEFTYDVLGRKKTRIDKEGGITETGNVTWYYDTAANGLGQVEMVLGNVSGYQVVYQYDSLGRNDTQLVDFDGSGPQPAYVTTTQFDSFGRVEKTFDALDDFLPSGQSGTENHYNDYGYLEKVTDLASGDLIKQTLEQTARGQLKRQLLGNGATSTFGYDNETGRLLTQKSDVLGVFGIQSLTYEWDTLGNLTSRHNQSGNKNLRESFCYDSLNRLVKTHIGTTNYACAGLSLAEQDVRYNGIGNITYKAGVGSYSYGQNSAGPHAVTTAGDVDYHYDANGNMTSDGFDGGRSIDYTTFDMAERITKGAVDDPVHVTEFKYGPERSRYYRKDTNSDSGETTETWYIGNVERIQKSSAPGEIHWKRHLAGAAIYTVKTDLNFAVQSTEKVFLYRDHLGSMDLLTDASSKVVQQMSFDAWGQRRNGLDWTSMTLPALSGFDHSRTTRGYTGHEMLDEVGLIHMNGRIYDPRLGRFMQADPFVQAAADTQMYNRYSYVRNNPMNATDPSGYFLTMAVAALAIALDVSVTAAAIMVGMAATMEALVNGASLGDALIAGISSAALSYLGGGGGGYIDLVNSTGQQFLLAALKFGVVGGITSILQGGKFGHGFASAFVGGMTGGIPGLQGHGGGQIFGRAVVGALVGGTLTKASGGKFANGAKSSALSAIITGIAGRYQQRLARVQLAKNPQVSIGEVKLDIDVGSTDLSIEWNETFFDPEFALPTVVGKEAPQVDMNIPGLNEGQLSEGWGIPDYRSPRANTGTYGADLANTGWNQSMVNDVQLQSLGMIGVQLGAGACVASAGVCYVVAKQFGEGVLVGEAWNQFSGRETTVQSVITNGVSGLVLGAAFSRLTTLSGGGAAAVGVWKVNEVSTGIAVGEIAGSVGN